MSLPGGELGILGNVDTNLKFVLNSVRVHNFYRWCGLGGGGGGAKNIKILLMIPVHLGYICTLSF